MTDINVNSEDFKAGYRQGYIDGATEVADRVTVMIEEYNKKRDEAKKSTDE